MLFHTTTRNLLAVALVLVSIPTWADGLTDYKQALQHLNQDAPFYGTLSAEVKAADSEGADDKEHTGRVSYHIQQNEHQLQILYDNQLMAQLHDETKKKQQLPTAETPITQAMAAFDYNQLNAVVYPLLGLNRDLDRSTFITEESTTLDGKPARILHFKIPLEKLPPNETKGIKKFTTHLDIWIDEEGMPLKSHVKGKGSGRFALVISFEFEFESDKSFTVVNNRLLTTRLTDTEKHSGAGMKGHRMISATLALEPLPTTLSQLEQPHHGK